MTMVGMFPEMVMVSWGLKSFPCSLDFTKTVLIQFDHTNYHSHLHVRVCQKLRDE